ncbi:hypothetical protein D623_10011326 [Myotis brandtii]|uniref:Uncharacterized protein n=1 Tax=Myotis brandtii TaxID=109478 RepID=S7Q9S2_MYOBR|nr:hypothetical protein D623_10011326 [Myotis brandtii]
MAPPASSSARLGNVSLSRGSCPRRTDAPARVSPTPAEPPRPQLQDTARKSPKVFPKDIARGRPPPDS